MLQTEARWLGAALTQREVSDLSPMLNVGSHTKDLRTRVQPWIDEHLAGRDRDRPHRKIPIARLGFWLFRRLHGDLRRPPHDRLIAEGATA